jgi:hypothetical protein
MDVQSSTDRVGQRVRLPGPGSELASLLPISLLALFGPVNDGALACMLTPKESTVKMTHNRKNRLGNGMTNSCKVVNESVLRFPHVGVAVPHYMLVTRAVFLYTEYISPAEGYFHEVEGTHSLNPQFENFPICLSLLLQASFCLSLSLFLPGNRKE